MEQLESTAVVRCATLPTGLWRSERAGLGRDALAVFRFRLSHEKEPDALVRALLQPDELVRAERYRRVEDQRRFVYARGLLRLLAGAYTHQPPASVRFKAGVNKKPELAGAAGWHFNVSHSGDWILIAFSQTPVGVDVEWVNPTLPLNDLLPTSFSPDERAYVAAQADARPAFFHLWTRKEALAKATAKGIDDDFYRLPCLEGTHHPPVHLLGQGAWMVWSFTVTDAYPAAVAHQATGLPDHGLPDHGLPDHGLPAEITTPRFYTLDAGAFFAGF